MPTLLALVWFTPSTNGTRFHSSYCVRTFTCCSLQDVLRSSPTVSIPVRAVFAGSPTPLHKLRCESDRKKMHAGLRSAHTLCAPTPHGSSGYATASPQLLLLSSRSRHWATVSSVSHRPDKSRSGSPLSIVAETGLSFPTRHRLISASRCGTRHVRHLHHVVSSDEIGGVESFSALGEPFEC